MEKSNDIKKFNDLRLRLFVDSDAETVSRWCDDRKKFFWWSAGLFGSYPLVEQNFIQFIREWSQKESYFPFIAFNEQGPQGFFIIRVPGENNTHVRFGFIILNPEIRGKGYGRQMLALAKKFALEIYGARSAELGVFEDNQAAVNCYRASGFKETGDTEEYIIEGTPWKCIEMKCDLTVAE